MIGDVSSSQIDSPCSTINGEALANGTDMGAAIANIEYYTRGETSRIERQDGTGVEKQFWHLVVLKEHLC